jgi:hypothetical protein
MHCGAGTLRYLDNTMMKLEEKRTIPAIFLALRVTINHAGSADRLHGRLIGFGDLLSFHQSLNSFNREN